MTSQPNDPDLKRVRKDSPPDSTEKVSSNKAHIHALKNAKLVKILKNFTHDKNIALHVKFLNKNDVTNQGDVVCDTYRDALVLIDKTPFPSELEVVEAAFASYPGELVSVMENDIYHKYSLLGGLGDINKCKVTVVDPATSKHLAKYTAYPVHIVKETGKQFDQVTRPHLISHEFTLNWVWNILEGKAEQDRLLYSDPDPDTGFIIQLDYKWDGKQIEDLYCLAIVRDRELKCLRDLRGTERHLALLNKIRVESRRSMLKKYGIASSQVRLYLHYLPSFYHLHVHITHVENVQPGSLAGKAHLLDEVIARLEDHSDFYATSTLCYTVQENDPLYAKLKSAGCIV